MLQYHKHVQIIIATNNNFDSHYLGKKHFILREMLYIIIMNNNYY